MNRLRTTHLPAPRLREALRSDLDTLPDAELLDRFARYADHPAFEALLRRYGPMVLGVCRRMLAVTDADDAFQATFLVLIRKARGLRGERLGPWLYGVAYRVGLKARTRAARIASFRGEVTDMIPDPSVPSGAPDWLPILDAELAAIPAKYRDALVLCELQGATRVEAAKALGVPEGTLSSRLARGREMLRRRLLKHGTLLPAGGLAALGENGIGRATVTTALWVRTSELAKVTKGAAAGAVPIGAAQLTDEVLKSMFLTKLRMVGPVLTALALAAIGVTATALPADGPAVPDRANGAIWGLVPEPRLPAAPPQPAPKNPAGAAPIEDVKAVQGLWSVVRFDTTKPLQEEAQFYYFEKNLHLFVAGDVWWEICDTKNVGMIRPCAATLHPGKNPKWLDMRPLSESAKRIIGMSDQRLYSLEQTDPESQLTIVSGFARQRPAEFNTQDADTKVLSLVFQRQKLGPPAGVPALLGSWEQPVSEYKTLDGRGRQVAKAVARAEVYDNLIFIGNLPYFANDESEWLGGSYTLDTSRNPPGIDITLFNSLSNDVRKLYGSYETTRDGLQLVLGLSGKRAERPMDFAPATAAAGRPERLYFDLKRAVLRLGEEPETAPAPKAKPTDKPAADPNGVEAIHKINAGEFAAAEKLLRHGLLDRTGSDAALDRVLLAACVIERARGAQAPESKRLWEEADELLRKAVAGVKGSPPDDKRAAWIRKQAALQGLKLLFFGGRPDEVIAAARAAVECHRGTVEELIVLSLVYHALRQKGEAQKALTTRAEMSAVFEKLKNKPGAFGAGAGERNRAYWEKEWFGEK